MWNRGIMQEKSPPVQVKEPYGNLDMVTCMLPSYNPECTKRVWHYIEKEIKFKGAFSYESYEITRSAQYGITSKAHFESN